MTDNLEKAWLWGFLCATGTITSDALSLSARYAKWGQDLENKERLLEDVQRLNHVLLPEYGCQVSAKSGPRYVLSFNKTVPTELISDLRQFTGSKTGELRRIAVFDNVLSWGTQARISFVSGFADGAGSVAPSHRRHSDKVQIISIELPGFNFAGVASLIRLFESIDIEPDQILFNHPNQHSAKDPFYRAWKKGFKIRLREPEFLKKVSFRFASKGNSARKNALKDSLKGIGKGLFDDLRVELTCVHEAENDPSLPRGIRGHHFISSKHLAAYLLGWADPQRKLRDQLANANRYVLPFPIPILWKGAKTQLKALEASYPALNKDAICINTTIGEADSEKVFSATSKEGVSVLRFPGNGTSYPVSSVREALNYIACESSGRLNGRRPTGSQMDNLNRAKGVKITIKFPQDGLYLKILSESGASTIVGAFEPQKTKGRFSLDGYLLKVKSVE